MVVNIETKYPVEMPILLLETPKDFLGYQSPSLYTINYSFKVLLMQRQFIS